MTLYADIALPLPLPRTFTYAVPASLEKNIRPGVRVRVPLGRRTATGFVVGLTREEPKRELSVKEIADVLDVRPFFSSSFLDFTRRLCGYYHCSWGEILEASLPPSLTSGPKEKVLLSAKGEEHYDHGLLTDKEKDLARLLKEKAYSPHFLRKKVRIRDFAGLLHRMENKGLIEIVEQKPPVRRKRPEEALGDSQLQLDFSMDERLMEAAGKISAAFFRKTSCSYLIFGPRGKREALYFELIRRTTASGGKTLFLVPEIALSGALRDKFEARLGQKAALIHSRLTESLREAEWKKIRDGKADVVAGPRSALFAPVDPLRLIIVEDEQDESYIQEESPAYDARRGARLRGEAEAAVVVFGSEGPSVEEYHRALEEDVLISLETPPRPQRVFYSDARSGAGAVGRELREKMGLALERKEPVYLFVNRKGYSPYLICPKCGWIPRCSRCGLAMTFHKKENRLFCHSCRAEASPPDVCSQCRAHVHRGRGWGAEAVEEEVRKIFPGCRTKIVDSDTAGRKEDLEKIRIGLEKGEAQVVVGTQFLAHQAGWPAVSLIGVLNPDATLSRMDFRSSQRTFQEIRREMDMLRDDPNAEAVIRTELPPHFSVRTAAEGRYADFYKDEIEFRRVMNEPPFSHLAEVTLLGAELRPLAARAREFLGLAADSGEDVEVLGPALGSGVKIKGINRVQVLLRAGKKEALDRVLGIVLDTVKGRMTVRILN